MKDGIFFIVHYKDDIAFFLSDLDTDSHILKMAINRPNLFTDEDQARYYFDVLTHMFPDEKFLFCDSFSQLVTCLNWNKKGSSEHG